MSKLRLGTIALGACVFLTVWAGATHSVAALVALGLWTALVAVDQFLKHEEANDKFFKELHNIEKKTNAVELSTDKFIQICDERFSKYQEEQNAKIEKTRLQLIQIANKLGMRLE